MAGPEKWPFPRGNPAPDSIMPNYDYVCEKCGKEFEVFQSMNDNRLEGCLDEGCDGRMKRKIGTGAGVIFKGSGFYETDYRSDSYKKGASAEKKGASGGDSSSSSSGDSSSDSSSGSSSSSGSGGGKDGGGDGSSSGGSAGASAKSD